MCLRENPDVGVDGGDRLQLWLDTRALPTGPFQIPGCDAQMFGHEVWSFGKEQEISRKMFTYFFSNRWCYVVVDNSDCVRDVGVTIRIPHRDDERTQCCIYLQDRRGVTFSQLRGKSYLPPFE